LVIFAIISLFVSFLQPMPKKHLFFNDFCELAIEQPNLFDLNPELKSTFFK